MKLTFQEFIANKEKSEILMIGMFLLFCFVFLIAAGFYLAGYERAATYLFAAAAIIIVADAIFIMVSAMDELNKELTKEA